MRIIMGCGSSKLQGAEDSIHVILSSEKKKQLKEKGGGGGGGEPYKPRKPHPHLVDTEPETDDNLDKLMYHAANHNDSVDKRDLEEYGDAVLDEDDDQAKGNGAMPT